MVKKFILLIILMLGFTSGGTLICVDFDPPSAPSNLTVSGKVGNILLTWSASTDEPDCSGIEYYNISRNNISLGISPFDKLSFTDTAVLNAGNYTYAVYAVDMVGHNAGAMINNDIIIEDDGTGGVGGVGGGGGGSSYVSQNYFKTYSVLDWQLKQGFSKTMEKKDKMVFNFGDEPHSMAVLNIKYNEVEVVISSTPQYAILAKGESKSFDLNEDNVFDLLVSVKNISNGFAEIEIQSLNEDSTIEGIALDSSSVEPDKNNEGFLSAITGAVTGAVGTAGGVGAIVFMVLVCGGFVAVRIKRMKK